jgi:hypothetical protein
MPSSCSCSPSFSSSRSAIWAFRSAMSAR